MPWINTSELRDEDVWQTKKHVTQLALDTFPVLVKFPPGTLMIALYGATIGRLGIVKIECVTNQACCGLALPKEVDIKFIFYWLLSYKEHVVSLALGGGQPNISQEVIKQLRLAVPPLSEQRAIVAYLESELTRLDGLASALRDSIILLTERRAGLISALVRGQTSSSQTI